MSGRPQVQSTSGDLTLTGPRSATVDATSDSGDTDTQFSAAPRRVAVHTTRGDINLVVPGTATRTPASVNGWRSSVAMGRDPRHCEPTAGSSTRISCRPSAESNSTNSLPSTGPTATSRAEALRHHHPRAASPHTHPGRENPGTGRAPPAVRAPARVGRWNPDLQRSDGGHITGVGDSVRVR